MLYYFLLLKRHGQGYIALMLFIIEGDITLVNTFDKIILRCVMSLIANRLKELRNSKELTQKDIAIAVGINERTYRRYEAGDMDPSATTIIKLSDFFDISADYLLGRTDNSKMY